MIFWIADDRHLSAVGSYHVTLRHRLDGVISSFRVDVGFQSEQEFFDGGFTEDRYESHWFERRNDFRAFASRQNRPARSFLKGNLLVGVDADDQHITEFSRAGEITNVPDMEHVETSIR